MIKCIGLGPKTMVLSVEEFNNFFPDSKENIIMNYDVDKNPSLILIKQDENLPKTVMDFYMKISKKNFIRKLNK